MARDRKQQPDERIRELRAEKRSKGQPGFKMGAGRYWVELPLDDQWIAYVRFVAQDGHPTIAELRVMPRPQSDSEEDWIDATLSLPESLSNTVLASDAPAGWRGPVHYGDELPNEPVPPAGGLTSRALRGAHLGRAVELAYEGLGLWFEQTSSQSEPELLERMAPAGFDADSVRVPRRPGRKGRDDRFYVTFAAAYVEALQRGSRQPVVAAAETLSAQSGGTYDAAYVRDVLHVARNRGLLTRPPRGRAGGALTEKALKLLSDDTSGTEEVDQ